MKKHLLTLLALLLVPCLVGCQPDSHANNSSASAESSSTSGDAPLTQQDPTGDAPVDSAANGQDTAPPDEDAPPAVRPAREDDEPPSQEITKDRVRNKRKIPGQPEDISFEDLVLEKMPVDVKFDESMLSDRVRELDQQKVRIVGFIYPGIFQQSGIKEFPLIRNTQCKFGPGGQAYHIILVSLDEGVTTDFTVQPVIVEGRLEVAPWEGPDGNTWALYRMQGQRVSKR